MMPIFRVIRGRVCQRHGRATQNSKTVLASTVRKSRGRKEVIGSGDGQEEEQGQGGERARSGKKAKKGAGTTAALYKGAGSTAVLRHLLYRGVGRTIQ